MEPENAVADLVIRTEWSLESKTLYCSMHPAAAPSAALPAPNGATTTTDFAETTGGPATH